MTQALAELRTPTLHEALRLRMVAMHGREDPLLEVGRFTRLLRQANDAEVADVRKIGDDEYEVSPHRMNIAPPTRRRASAAAPSRRRARSRGRAASGPRRPPNRAAGRTGSVRAFGSAADPAGRSGPVRSR